MNIDAVVFPLSVNGTPDDNKRVDVEEAFPSLSIPRGQRTGWTDCICANEKRIATIPKKKKIGFSLPAGLITFPLFYSLLPSFSRRLAFSGILSPPPSMMRFSVEQENRASINRCVVSGRVV